MVTLVKVGGALGLSIVGGINKVCHPFGIDEPGIFISKVCPEHGLFCSTSLTFSIILCIFVSGTHPTLLHILLLLFFLLAPHSSKKPKSPSFQIGLE